MALIVEENSVECWAFILSFKLAYFRTAVTRFCDNYKFCMLKVGFVSALLVCKKMLNSDGSQLATD